MRSKSTVNSVPPTSTLTALGALQIYYYYYYYYYYYKYILFRSV